MNFPVCKKSCFWVIVCYFLTFPLYGNNVKVTGTPKPVVEGDTVNLTFTLSWENSWRDKYNWDAAWIFLKYKMEGSAGAWSHLCLADSYRLPSDLMAEPGRTGSDIVGMFIYRKDIGGGHLTNRKITLKAPVTAFKNATADALKKGTVYIAVSALEMVYVPFGAYYLGDGASAGSFFAVEQSAYGEIPEEADLINRHSGYIFSASRSDAAPENAANHGNSPDYSTLSSWYHNATSEAWWKVDFGEAKTIRFFGISGAMSHPSYAPTDIWYLEGSEDNTNWRLLTAVHQKMWQTAATCYPVQQSFKVNTPGAYRYYRLRFPRNNRIIIQNIAMTDQQLYMADAESGMVIEDESAKTVVTGNGLSFTTAAIGADFPKGYNGFYCMKYELSQEQYASFLNMLSYAQQKNRIGNNLDQLKKGDYVFGDASRPSARNGICVYSKPKDKPVLFANNLNPSEPYYAEDDGQTLPCNYLTPSDLLAYCDWAGLRPMSELEYEKACRRPYPQISVPHEYAWNQTTYDRITGLSDLVTAQNGTGKEKPVGKSKNVNAGNPALGPVRCGSFGIAGSTQAEAGATYWGLMEMSGNLAELCYSVAATGFKGNNVTYSYGNGELTVAGLTDIATTYWPASATATYFTLRGGSFASADSNLRVSDRSVTGVSEVRDSTIGFRGVRGSTEIVLNGGEISAPDTVCWSGSWISEIVPAQTLSESALTFSYTWYVQKPGSSIYELITGETGEKLWYDGFQNESQKPVIYSFKRIASCPLGKAESNEVTVKLLNKPFFVESEVIALGAPVGQNWGKTMSVQWTLENAPVGASVGTVGENSVNVEGLKQNDKFVIKASWAQCPSDVFSKKVTVGYVFNYTGAGDSVVLVPGKYRIECWGAGGYPEGEQTDGLGAYTSGEIVLSEQKTLYVYVGQAGYNVANVTTFNGGTGSSGGYPGGGASDVRLVWSSNWKDFNSLKSRIMVAGGGGTGSYAGGAGGLVGYTGGGAGGGSQTSPGSIQSSAYLSPGFGYGGGGCGGGGGYYGGGASTCVNGAGGGSSFISGHSGCNAIGETSVSSSIVHTAQPVHYSGMYFTNTVMIDGKGNRWTDSVGGYIGIPSPDGIYRLKGHQGNGLVKIAPL